MRPRLNCSVRVFTTCLFLLPLFTLPASFAALALELCDPYIVWLIAFILASHTETTLETLLQQETVDLKRAQKLVDSAPEGPAKVHLQRLVDEAKTQLLGACVCDLFVSPAPLNSAPHKCPHVCARGPGICAAVRELVCCVGHVRWALSLSGVQGEVRG
jgi:hypothetical protein